MQYHGQIVKIVPTMGLAYLEASDSGRVIGFSISQLEGFNGESFAEFGVVPGAKFDFTATEDGRVLTVSKAMSSLSASANG